MQGLQWLLSAQDTNEPHPDFCSLKWWTLQINQHTYNLLLDRSSARDRALIRCLTDRHANTWLQPCPTENLGLRLIPAEYSILSKFQLGEPILPPDSEPVCAACGDSADVYGDHSLCCPKGGLIQRHTAIASQLWRTCTATGIRVRPEVSLDNRTRPADLLLSHWQGGGPCAVDVAVVHPLAPSTPVTAVKDGSEAIAAMERVKFVKYADACRESNLQFIPFVLFTFGKLGGEGDRFWQHLASSFRPNDPDFDTDIPLGTLYMQQLQMVLRREVARMLLQGQAGHSSNDNVSVNPALDDLLDDYARLETGTLPPRPQEGGVAQ